MPRRVVKGTCLLFCALFVAACAAPAVEARRGNPVGAVMEFSDRNDMVELEEGPRMAPMPVRPHERALRPVPVPDGVADVRGHRGRTEGTGGRR